MLAQVLRPLRGFGSRLFATPVGTTKSAIDNDQLHAFPPSDADFLAPDPSSVVAFGSFDANDINDSVADLPVIWPNHSVFNGPSSQNGDMPWVDMKMYQARVASYHQPEAPSQVPNGFAANPMLMLQPVLMPVFCPFWSMAAQQASMFPAAAIDVVMQKSGGPLADLELTLEACEGTQTSAAMLTLDKVADTTDGTSARRHRRSRRGGASMRKKMAAACHEEVVELMTAVNETTQAVASRRSSPSTPQRWADIDMEEEGDLLFSKAAVHLHVADAAGVNGVERVNDGEVADAHGTTHVEEGDTDSPISYMQGSSSGASVSTEAIVDPVLLELDNPDQAQRQLTLDWVLSSFWPLALTKRGCRIVQKAIDVGSPAYQQQLVENLHGRVQEAMKSPHTNYVLQKCIETMPPDRMLFVLAELQGQALYVARHRFGCRIIQRLIEHCPPPHTEKLIDEVLVDTASLCRHQYGNFVIQHILQHGSPTQRSAIAAVIEEDLIRLAKHRIASHVVSSSMVHCPAEDVHRLTQVVMHDAGQLADLSRREYGSFVVREVNRAARLLRG